MKQKNHAREYSRVVIQYAHANDQRTGQYMFNSLPDGAREAVTGKLWDPFFKDWGQDKIEEWLLQHALFNDSGEIIGVISGSQLLWGRRRDDG